MSTTQQQPLNFIDIVIQFYCSLTGKKDLQTLTSQISDFVMNHALSDKQVIGNKILEYFLKLYSKYNMKTETEWDRAFQLSSAQDRATTLIANFPQRTMCRWGFTKLKQRTTVAELYSQTIYTQISGSQLTLIDQIQVQEDIKLKTKYFFKWCLYLKSAKNFKDMKMKTVNNMKMSQCFNTYGMRFNYFTAWKMLLKKKKSYKEKSEKISQQIQESMLRRCLKQMSECGKILVIEDQLASVIKKKVNTLNKVRVFKSLKINSQFLKCLETRSYHQNLYAYRFVQSCTRGISMKMNKSYLQYRHKFNQDYKNCLMKKIMEELKKRVAWREKHQKQLQNTIKSSRMKTMIANSRKNTEFLENQRNFTEFLALKKKKIIITILHFNMITNQQKQFEEASILQSRIPSHTDRRILQVHKKKQLKENYKLLTYQLNKNSKLFVFTVLNNKKIAHELEENNCLRVTNLWKDRFFIHHRKNLKVLQQRKQFYKQIEQIRENMIKKKMIKKWKKIKDANQIELSSLNSLSSICNRSLQRKFLLKLEKRATESQRLNQFADILKSIILRVGFEKIGGRTFYINREVSYLMKNKRKSQMTHLFKLLSQNSKYNQHVSAAIPQFCRVQAQHKLIHSLKTLHKIKKQQTLLTEYLSKSSRSKYTKYFKFIMKRDQTIQAKKNYLTAKKFLTNFKKSKDSQLKISHDLSLKEQDLSEYLCISSAVRFIKGLKFIFKRVRNYEEKSTRILELTAIRSLQKIKEQIKQFKQRQQIERTGKRVTCILMSKAIKNFAFDSRSQNIFTNISMKRKRERVENMVRTYELEIKLKEKRVKVEKSIFTRKSVFFLKNINEEIKQLAYKQQLLNKKKMQFDFTSKCKFLSLLHANKENQAANLKLLTSKTHRHLSELLTTFYKRKYGEIKYKYALKLYATNLLKKTIKGMKKEHERIRHKENTIKFDKTASMIAQKSIERSFKSNSLSEQIEKFNMRKSRQIIR